jgi:hypothetical protein
LEGAVAAAGLAGVGAAALLDGAVASKSDCVQVPEQPASNTIAIAEKIAFVLNMLIFRSVVVRRSYSTRDHLDMRYFHNLGENGLDQL